MIRRRFVGIATASLAGCARFSGGNEGHHEATISGADWSGQVARDAGTCTLYDGTVAASEERLDVAGECADRR